MHSRPNTTSTSTNFEGLFEAALAKFTKCTGQDLRNHPIATLIDRCTSPNAILAVFQEQSLAFHEFRNGDPRLIGCLKPIVDGLHAISTNAAVSTGASLAFPPANIVFSGIGFLLSTAKYVRSSYDGLVDILECIENFTRRLKIYTEIQPTPALTDTIIKIMAEMFSVVVLTTEEMRQGKLKKYAKKLMGENKVEEVLQRLDRLTLEESKNTVAQTLDIVCGLVNNLEAVMEGGKTTTVDIRQSLVLMQEIATKANEIKHSQLHENFRRWLSPPDPWSNHNIAREAHHGGTATWFTQGETFAQWKSTGLLLWVNGLPGSGKTIISSSIIEELEGICQTGLDTLVIFYCDFRDTKKQNARNLLSSILIQFCHRSDAFSEILSSLYSKHSDGSREPSIDALLGCLKAMLALRGQGTLYVVVDALDECPNSSGLPTQREQVLKIVKELIDLKLPHIRFCVTSRPEIDIRKVFEPLGPYNVSLHNQRGQIEDLAKYVEEVVRSDEAMRDWPEDTKNLVIDTLAEKGGGMFRWAHCQLETLRQCPLRNISRSLKELPETLDDTYERILLAIPKAKREDAHRIFQWLLISSRPPRVEELAEVFTFDFDAETSGIPKFDPSWRPSNAEASVLSACSTLVSVVKATDSFGEEKIVAQFAHFSVEEYLTSDRMANSALVSHFHVPPKPAHTLLAKACLSVLLQLDYSIDRTKILNLPLAQYAAEHWVDHAQFEDVSSDIRDGMDCLFDKNKPHFAAWIWANDIDDYDENCDHADEYEPTAQPEQPHAVPLYYAALSGFRALAERLLDAHPQDVYSQGGHHGGPLNAALHREHPNIALFLLERVADLKSRGCEGQTALYKASSRGYSEVMQSLLGCGADPDPQCDDWDDGCLVKSTPQLVASKNDRLEVARVLLEQGVDVNYRDQIGWSSLLNASQNGCNDIARLLLDHGANLNTSDNWGYTALHAASFAEQITVVTLLLEHGANVDTWSEGETPLHYAAYNECSKVVQLLLDHGADVNAQTYDGRTALLMAAERGNFQVVEVLLERGADPLARTDKGETPFRLASESTWREAPQVARLLSGALVRE